MDDFTSSSWPVSSLSTTSCGPAMVEISKETITLCDEVDQVRIKRNTDHNLAGSFSLQEDSNMYAIEEGPSSTPSSNLKHETMIRVLERPGVYGGTSRSGRTGACLW